MNYMMHNVLNCRNVRNWRQVAKNNNDDAKKLKKMETTTNGDEQDLDKPAQNSLEDGSDDVKREKDLLEDVEISDNAECRFNLNSCKMLFVVKSENYLYKKNALRKAHQVSVCLKLVAQSTRRVVRTACVKHF